MSLRLGKEGREVRRGRTTRGAPSTIRPFFGFYGGKWRDAPKYYPVPEHDTIVEPFERPTPRGLDSLPGGPLHGDSRCQSHGPL